MREIAVLIRARYSLLYLVSWEERRVLAALQEIVVGQNKQLYTWSETTGLRSATKQPTPGAADSRARDPLSVLDSVRTNGEAAVYVRGQEGVNVELTGEQRERLLKAALGLTLTEAENVFARCLVEKGAFDVDLI